MATSDESALPPFLISYAWVKKWSSLLDDLDTIGPIRIMFDSGAFSAKMAGLVVTVEEYTDFIIRARSRISRHSVLGFVALDVLGNVNTTEANLIRMVSMLGHESGLIPVLTTAMKVERGIELANDFGIVAVAGGAVFRNAEWAAARSARIMNETLDKKVHLLGVAPEKIIIKSRATSADSTSWCRGIKFGKIGLHEDTRTAFSSTHGSFGGSALAGYHDFIVNARAIEEKTGCAMYMSISGVAHLRVLCDIWRLVMDGRSLLDLEKGYSL